LGATVLLIPHEIKAQQTINELNDDRLLIMKVAAVLGSKRVVAMTGNYTAPQVKSIISHLDLLIGSRFHALVGALSSHVPVVALGWSHKYVELLRDVGLEDFCTGHDELDWDQVRQKMMQVWTERDALSVKLRNCVPVIQGKIDDTFDQVAEVLKSGVDTL
jgi:polysaccharide pyruvyl transferase WcaK-like protein